MTIYLALTPTIIAAAGVLWCGWRRDAAIAAIAKALGEQK